jgi:two-component system NtrC family sensor kinase
MVHREDRRAVLDQAAHVRAGKEPYPVEHRIIHKNGSIRWIRNAPVPRYDNQGRMVGYDGLITDITERKKSEAILRESEEKYRALFEASKDAIFLETLDGQILDCNTSACNTYGYAKEELLRLKVADLVPDDFLKIFPGIIKKELEEGGATFETANKRKNGELFPCDVSTRLTEVGGEQRVIAYVRDITEHNLAEQTRLRQIQAETRAVVAEAAKLELEQQVAERNQAEAALRESEARLRTLIDNLPFEFWAVDNSLHYIMQNTTSIKNYGNVVGKRVDQLDMPEDVIAQWVKEDEQALHGVTLHQGFERYVNGEKRAYENSVAPVIVGNDIIGIVGVGMDVTERKRAESVLQQRARQLTLINEISGRIAAVLDLDSLLDRAAQLIQETFNYHHVALFSIDGERNELIMKAKSGSFARLYPISHRLKMDQGIVGWVGIHGEKLLVNDVRQEPKYVNLYPEVISTLSELSVPIRVGEELVGVLDVQSPLVNAFDDDDVLVIETLADQIAVAIENARLYKAMERELAERKQAEAALQESEKRYRTLVGTSPDAIFYINLEREVILSNQRAAELYGVDSPNEMLGMSALDLFAPESHSWLWEEIANFPRGWSVRGQEFILTKRDGTHFPAEVGASLVVNEKGEPLGVICVVRDISQRKLLEQYLVRTERLTAMGKISAELAHEIKNPLQSIQSNVELVLDFALDPNERQVHLSLCYEELERLIGLTNRLLNMANPNKMTYESVPVSDLVQRALVLVDKSLKTVGASVNSNVPDNLPLVRVVPDQIVEVLLNLSINAIEAMPEGGEINITAEAVNGWVKLAVIHSGDLIPQEHLESIFEPFFTTKPGGTGLGLSISHQIIQDMGGSLAAENLHDPDRVSFTIMLPALDLGRGPENVA